MTKTTITYETETCSRCAGSGHYSRCQMYGTICFKCAGRKIAQSRAGAKAHKAVQAFIAEHFSVKVAELQVGDYIRHDGKARKIAAIQTDGGRYGHQGPNGETVWEDGVTVTFARSYKTAFGPVSSCCFHPNTVVVKAPTGADWDAVVAFARTIKKGCTVVETVVPEPVNPNDASSRADWLASAKEVR